MRAFHFAICAVFCAVLALPAPARADQILGQGRIIESGPNAGDLLLGSLRLGKRQLGKTTLMPDALAIQGPGSTGDVSGMSATGNGVTVPISKLVLKGPNIVDRGAVADWNGTTGTDNSAAVAAQLAAECVIRVPAGSYRVTQAFTTTCNNVVIEGTGILSSRLIFDNPSIVEAIKIAPLQLNEKTGVEIRNVSIMTTQVNKGTAVSVVHPPNIGAYRSHLRFITDNVQFGGADLSTKSWAIGLDLKDVLAAKFVNTSWIGSGGTQGTGLRVGVSQGNEASPYIFTGCDWWYVGLGVDISGWAEGFAISDANFVYVGTAIKFIEGGPGGFLSMTGSHISAFGPGIVLGAAPGYFLQQVVLSGNVMFQSMPGEAILDMSSVLKGNIHDNQFWSFNSGTTGAKFRTSVQDVLIHDNLFVSSNGYEFAWGIDIGDTIFAGNSVGNRIYNNRFVGPYLNGTINDTISASSPGAVSYGNPGSTLSRSAPISFVSNANQTLVYDMTNFDGAPSFNGGSGALAIPARSGIRRARVCGSLYWDANGTGLRRIMISRNGTSTEAGSTSPAVAGEIHHQSVCTGYMSVVEGDAFYLVGLQTSGVDLNANDARFSIEVMP